MTFFWTWLEHRRGASLPGGSWKPGIFSVGQLIEFEGQIDVQVYQHVKYRCTDSLLELCTDALKLTTILKDSDELLPSLHVDISPKWSLNESKFVLVEGFGKFCKCTKSPSFGETSLIPI